MNIKNDPNYFVKFYFILFFICMVFACQEQSENKQVNKLSQIKVLNGCGFSKAAQKMADFLISKGFDVVEKGNAEHWHYKKTIIISTVKNTDITEQLSKTLKGSGWVQMIDSSQLVSAVVIVGRDFFQLLN